ncbi:transposase [Streptomyces sp. NBC_01276]|uniref:transposase n=1 Tax=Streptomyces sp. NBC_01276 TaxID=2903808 RepID=UPI002F9106A2
MHRVTGQRSKKFLTKLDTEAPADLQVHLIPDNCATHRTPSVKRWLPAHSRFHLHFTPTRAPWLNLVERWFAGLAQKKLKRGVHRSVQALERDIRAWSSAASDRRPTGAHLPMLTPTTDNTLRGRARRGRST